MKRLVFRLLALALGFTQTGFAPVNSIPEIVLGTGKQPNICVSPAGEIKITYGAGNAIYYITSKDKGQTFSKPVTVAELPKLSLGMGRGPQIAATEDFTLITATNEAGNIFAVHLPAGKTTWQKPVKINDADTVAKEGFVSVTTGPNKRAYAVWLDLRHDNQNKIYGARSDNGGRTWQPNRLIYKSPDKTVCECCKPTVTADVQGKVYVQFRNWLQGSRDLHLISSDNLGRTFGPAQKLGTGTWQLKGCPMDGGDLAVAANGSVTTVWRREQNIYLAKPGQSEKLLGPGKTPTLVETPAGPAVAWQQQGEIVFLGPKAGSVISLGTGTFPQLALLPKTNTAVCVFERAGQVVVKQLAL
jgi:hypothetical protein